MRELILPVEQPQIKINGHVFDLKMSDIEILEYANEALTKYGAFQTGTHTNEEIITALHALVGTIDSLLGVGATKIISGGRPVRMHLAILWLAKIAESAAQEYAEAVTRD